MAHEGHDHGNKKDGARTWTFAKDGDHVHGAYVASGNGRVQIRRQGGAVISLEIAALSNEDKQWIQAKTLEVKAINERVPDREEHAVRVVSTIQSPPAIAESFEPFAKLNALQYHWDDRYFFVECDAMPRHRMMVGITAWQQQVPLPQPYFGNNAWRIPLHPVVAEKPLSAKSHFFRGAIALAANGVPIFNPIKNDGKTDTFLAGELDEFGGHCGRGDDYHYHIAPTHLQEIVGQGKPIAYALDGYPIYGFEEPDGAAARNLDAFNGHDSPQFGYHYHATKTYPYLNGGFHGEVQEVGGQVDPQPQAGGVREALTPLRGAKITNFESKDNQWFRLQYVVGRETRYVTYTINNDGSVRFDFTDGNGNVKTETYQPRQRGPKQGGRDAKEKAPGGERPRTGNRSQTPDSRRAPPNQSTTPQPTSQPTSQSKTQFAAGSSAINRDGMMDAEFTCDGKGVSPPVHWTDPPSGTKAFAVSIWHTAPDQEKSYWLVYNIPADVSHLEQNDHGHGTVGVNDKKKASYDPMCSKGPGAKTYHITVYALAAEVQLSKGSDHRKNFLKAIEGNTLAEVTIDFQYARDR